MRTLGLGSLRLKIVAFTLLSLVGGLSQAVLLVLISEVAVAEVEGKHSVHALGPLLLTDERDHRRRSWPWRSSSSTSIVGTLLSTSVSEQALTRDPYTRRHRVLPVQLVPPIHRAARASPTAPHDEQRGHRQLPSGTCRPASNRS